MTAMRGLTACAALLLCQSLVASSAPRLMDFSAGADEPRWVAVNDGVMGGRSSGGPRIADGLLVFSGDLSLENNGGFSSIRTVQRRYDFADAKAVLLRVRGDGRTYQLRFATDARYRGWPVAFGAEFPTRKDEWTVARVPLDALQPSVFGTVLRGPSMDPARVREISLMIADKREGAFALSVDWIALESPERP